MPEEELTVRMAGFGRETDVSVSAIPHQQAYGWRIVVDDSRDEVMKMSKDDLNDWAARNLPHIDLDPSQMKKKEMQTAICKELNWELPE